MPIVNLYLCAEKSNQNSPKTFVLLGTQSRIQKTYQLVEYNPMKSSNDFVKSAVEAQRQEDEIPNCSVIAETMKLFAISSHGYQIKDWSRVLV